MSEQESVLFDFQDAEQAGHWRSVNDVVMGGLSTSEMVPTAEGTAILQGHVSLENYGGFASVRTHPHEFQLGGYEGLALRVKGDGKTYRLRFRTDSLLDGIAYQSSFATVAGTWTTVRVPFGECRPTFRGRDVRGAPALDGARIQQIGLMIADKQQGPFRLEVDWIVAYRRSG